MTEHTRHFATLMDVSGSNLHRTILHSIPTGSGKMWANITPGEAMIMMTSADKLRNAFPDPQTRLAEVQTIIDEGLAAAGLLAGYFDVDGHVGDSFACDDCRNEGGPDRRGRF